MERARRTLLLTLTMALLLTAPAAAAAVERIRIDWSATNPPGAPHFVSDPAPSVDVFFDGGSTAQYFSNCDREGPPCSAGGGFRWLESNHEGGRPRTVSFVDDRSQDRRPVCFEIQHPAPVGDPVDPTYALTITVTDPNGTQRTRSATLRKGERTELNCSPVLKPAAPARERAPGWWRDGERLIRARGGKCRRESSRAPASHPVTGRKEGQFTEITIRCFRALPRSVAKRLNVPLERCVRGFARGDPGGNDYFAFCQIVSAARPMRAAWKCSRFMDYAARRDLRDSDAAWSAQLTPSSSKYPRHTLRACRTRRPPGP